MKLYISDCRDGYSLMVQREPLIYYSTQYIVSIEWTYDRDQPYKVSQEWQDLVDTKEIDNGRWIPDREHTLKPNLIEWLNNNVKDSTDKRRSDMPVAWMHKPSDNTSVEIFFLRRADAEAFINHFGKLHKVHDRRD